MDRAEFVEFLASIESNPVCKSWIGVLDACEPDDDMISIRDILLDSDSRGYALDYDDGELYICHPYFIGDSLVEYYKLGWDNSFELKNTTFDRFVSRIKYTLSNEYICDVKKCIDTESKKADTANALTKPAWVL